MPTGYISIQNMQNLKKIGCDSLLNRKKCNLQKGFDRLQLHKRGKVARASHNEKIQITNYKRSLKETKKRLLKK